MSSTGVAHHKRRRGTIGGFSDRLETARRAARVQRFAPRDEEYRRALKLCPGDPLPGRIGMCGRAGGRPKRRTRRPSCAL